MKAGRALALAAVVALAAAAPYVNAPPGAFHFDDFHSIVDNPALGWASPGQLFTYPALFSGRSVWMYRPLTVLSLALQVRAGGLDPAPMIRVNIALHALAAALVFAVVLALARSPRRAALAGLIFGLHPLQTQAVNYISCRSSILAAAITLAAVGLALAAARPGRARPAALLLAVLLLAAALLAKSEVFAAALLPWLFMAAPSGEGPRRKWGPVAAGFIIVAASYLVLRWQMGIEVMVPKTLVRPIPANLATGARVIVSYLGLALWPRSLAVVHDLVPSASLWDPSALAAALGLAVLFYSVWRLRRRRPLLLVGYGWFLLGLAPTTTLAPLRNVMAEHHLYFALAGLAMMAAEALAALGEWGAGDDRRRAAIAAAVALLLASYVGLDLRRNRDWQNEDALWTSAVERSPGSATAWGNYGVARWTAGRVGAARAAFAHALVLDPANLESLANLGRIRIDDGDAAAGIAMLETAAKAAPNEPTVHYNLGRGYFAVGRDEDAAAQLTRAMELQPGYLIACEALGAVYGYNLQQPERAREVLAQCLVMEPSPEEVRRIRALLLKISGGGTPP
jgi:protein O-mannosyl-transferase